MELDRIVEICTTIGERGGVYGARMTGGGFGGCAVVLVRTAAAASVMERVSAPEFWQTFDADPYDHLEFLENQVAPLATDADMLALRYVGTDPKVFAQSSSPYIRELADLHGDVAQDPHYFDPSLTGSDEIEYRIALPPGILARADHVQATLYYQSIPPFYLQQRFAGERLRVRPPHASLWPPTSRTGAILGSCAGE